MAPLGVQAPFVRHLWMGTLTRKSLVHENSLSSVTGLESSSSTAKQHACLLK